MCTNAGAVEVSQALIVKSIAQKRMVIGKDGNVVKKLQTESEHVLTKALGKPVQLTLTVTTENRREALERR